MQCRPNGAARQRPGVRIGRRLHRRGSGSIIGGEGRIAMYIRWGLAGLLLVSGLGRGADPPVEKLAVKPRVAYWAGWTPPTGSVADQVKAVSDRQKQLQDDFFTRYKAAKSQAEKSAMARTEYPEADAPGNMLLELAR